MREKTENMDIIVDKKTVRVTTAVFVTVMTMLAAIAAMFFTTMSVLAAWLIECLWKNFRLRFHKFRFPHTSHLLLYYTMQNFVY